VFCFCCNSSNTIPPSHEFATLIGSPHGYNGVTNNPIPLFEEIKSARLIKARQDFTSLRETLHCHQTLETTQ